VFIFGGILEDGKFNNWVQVFNVRNRETENACRIDQPMCQPFNVLNFGGKTLLFTNKGELFVHRTECPVDSNS
jgi:hypothetical protein